MVINLLKKEGGHGLGKGRGQRVVDKREINNIVKAVEKDSRILALLLIGSVARGEDYEGSDVDLCLILMPSSYQAIELSKKKLAYRKQFNLDIHVFQQLPLYVKRRVLRDGKVLFCRDTEQLYEVAFMVIREFAHFEHIYRDYLKEVADAG